VGVGQQYQQIAKAIAASRDGDVVAVQAGTYVNDFATIYHKIMLQGVGGMVKMVATVAPTNGKAILTTASDVTIDHFEFSGAKVADENGRLRKKRRSMSGSTRRASHAMKATMTVMIATALHAIATGNMLPAFVTGADGQIRQLPTICVDSSEFVVSKLKDRGTHQAFGVVTNAQDFMHILRLYVERELGQRGTPATA